MGLVPNIQKPKEIVSMKSFKGPRRLISLSAGWLIILLMGSAVIAQKPVLCPKVGKCHFRTPDGKETDKLDPINHRNLTGKKQTPANQVFDTMPDPKDKCPEEACRCYILRERINKKTGKADINTLYAGDGDTHKLTLQQVQLDEKDMKEHPQWEFKYSAVCATKVDLEAK